MNSLPSRAKIGLAIGLSALLALVATAFIFGPVWDDGSSSAAKGSKHVADPTPTVSPTETWEQQDNRLANRVLNSAKFGPHFKCHEHPAAANLHTRDLIPTSNVVVLIEFDDKSGSYKVTKSDPRVTVRHVAQPVVSYETNDPTTTIEDRFTWTADAGVETYGWFQQYRAVKGLTWGGSELYGSLITDTDHPEYDQGLIIANRSNNNNTLRYAIVLTDTATCKGADAAPSGMWKDLTEAGLNLPYAARL